MHNGPSPLVVTLVILVLLPLLYRRVRKLSRPQPLKLARLWIRPALILVVCAMALFLPQPGSHAVRLLSPPDWLWLALAGAAGAIAGWQMGRTMKIEVHPEDGTLMTRGSVAAVVVIVVLLLFRVGLRTGLALEGQALHLDVLLISDASIVFSALLFTVRSLEMYLRARRIMRPAA
jgi:drug/metabolite transporter (DMT)-like permease